MEPLVSFVVPCYKLAHLVPECVNSILAQTYQNFEVLIMDNCSPDNTPEVARSFRDPRVKHMRNEMNVGHVRNFNKGIAMSRGKYVWLVSADDFLRSPEVLQQFVQLMERHPRVGYVFCRAVLVLGSEEVGVADWTNVGDNERIWRGKSFLKRLIESNCIVMSSVMGRKECYEKAGLFRVDMPYACDWYLWCALALLYDVAYLPQPMVGVRLHDDNLTSSFNRQVGSVCIADEANVLWNVYQAASPAGIQFLRGKCFATIANKASRALNAGSASQTNPGPTEADLREILLRHIKDSRDENDIWARIHIALGDAHYWSGDRRKAKQSYQLALKLRPWWLKTWAKYFFLQSGRVGTGIRRLLSLKYQGHKAKGLSGNVT